MPVIELTNDFHDTEARLRPVAMVENPGYYAISHRTVLRLRRELCGSPDCACGGQFGERGGAAIEVVNETYERGLIVYLPVRA